MNTLTRIGQRVIGGLVLLTLGIVAGQVMAPSPALGSLGCPKESCVFVGGYPDPMYECTMSSMDWSCGLGGGGQSCITEECPPEWNPCYPLVCMEGGGQG